MLEPDTNISCVILAGGEGKRVGKEDKGLIRYKNKLLIEHVINIIMPQTDEIIISANRNIDRYENFGFRVISDQNNTATSTQYHGPLAGIAASIPYCEYDWVLIVPCDMPFLPSDTVIRLSTGITESNICIAKSDGNLQLAFLINKKLLSSLQHALHSNKLSLMRWIRKQDPYIVEFPSDQNFRNFNHTADFEWLPFQFDQDKLK